MVRYAVIGYGKLGKAVCKRLLEDKKVFALYSRRKLEITNFPVFPIKDIAENSPDIAFLCCGSATDSLKLAPYVAQFCNTVDCFDNHNRMSEYLDVMRYVCQTSGKMAVIGAGWDPGLFSSARVMASLIAPPVTFWGKGLSQGHTNAVKKIKGVDDALCFTLPDKNKINKAKRGEQFTPAQSHFRLCYVVAENSDLKGDITDKIINMPDYFKGYRVKVCFVSPKRLSALVSYSHKGRVISQGNSFCFDLSLSTADNASLTAQIMLAYSSVIISHFSQGAYTVLDLPLSYLSDTALSFM